MTMIPYITESEVEAILTMPKTIELVEAAHRARAEGRAFDVPRSLASFSSGALRILQAEAAELKLIGCKVAYSATGKGTHSYVHLFDTDSGKQLATIESIHLSMMRTGAATGVATRYLARADASVVGMIGAGGQAVGQLEAVCAVRKIREARVYSRNAGRVRAFCTAMENKLGVRVRVATSAAEAVRGADIVNVITNAATPVLAGEWLEPGQHINAAGSNALTRRELDEAAVRRCGLIVVDGRGNARTECGDLLPLVERGFYDWDALPELGEVITGRAAGRSAEDEITLYESHGMGIQDIYTARFVLDTAKQSGLGVQLPVGA
jgi:ornithine cyclodeaminase